MNIKDNVLFLGIAEHFKDQNENRPYPVGRVDILGLTKVSNHIFFPINIEKYHFVFFINPELFEIGKTTKFKINIVDPSGKIQFYFNADLYSDITEKISDKYNLIEKTTEYSTPLLYFKDKQWLLIKFDIKAILHNPGEYSIYVGETEANEKIDTLTFNYCKVHPFTFEQMEAIKSNPLSVKKAIIKIGCSFCPSTIQAYTALNKDLELEKKDYIWQANLKDEFHCQCGKTIIPLSYLRESFHGIMLKSHHTIFSDINAVRRYGHEEVIKVISKFKSLIAENHKEEIYQKFIEENPLIMAKYHAQKIFYKKDVIGKFKTDFIIYDSMKRLVLIEIEKPTTQLFTKNEGHPTQELIHAYSQVNDWLHEKDKHFMALLDALNIEKKEISAISGVVIAGRSKTEEAEVLFKHRMSNIYSNIEFLTYDELADSVLQISRKLA